LLSVYQIFNGVFVGKIPGLLAHISGPFAALVNFVVAIHAQRGHQVVVGFNSSPFAAAPVRVRRLDALAAAAQLAIQTGH
jgi:hypothetical protein